jgi:hypothetical protein
MEKAGRIVGHGIGFARHEGELVAVAVVALMEGRQLAERGGRASCGLAAFEVARDGGAIV